MYSPVLVFLLHYYIFLVIIDSFVYTFVRIPLHYGIFSKFLVSFLFSLSSNVVHLVCELFLLVGGSAAHFYVIFSAIHYSIFVYLDLTCTHSLIVTQYNANYCD